MATTVNPQFPPVNTQQPSDPPLPPEFQELVETIPNLATRAFVTNALLGVGKTTDAGDITTGIFNDERFPIATPAVIQAEYNALEPLIAEKFALIGEGTPDDGTPVDTSNLLTAQTEVIAYQKAVLAAGGGVSLQVLAALDQFVLTGKRDGWWGQVLEMWIPSGSNLAAAFVKLKGVVAAYTNHGFLEVDYTQDQGFGDLLNTSKYLTTGFIPSAQGLSAGNISFALSIVSDSSVDHDAVERGWMSGTPTAQQGETSPAIGTTHFGLDWYSDNMAQYASGGPRHILFTGRSDSWGGWIDGVKNYAGGGRGNTMTTELILLGITRYGGRDVAAGKISLFAVMGALTDAQGDSFQRAQMALDRKIRVNTRTFTLGGFGDSNMKGQGTTESFPNRRHLRLIANRIGARELNWGVPSGRTTENGPVQTVSGINRSQQAADLGAEVVIVQLGTNDANNDGNPADPTAKLNEYEASLTTIVSRFVEKRSRVLVGGVMWSTAKTAEAILGYNMRAAKVAAAFHVPYVDLDFLFRDQANPAASFSDGLHTNDVGTPQTADAYLLAYYERAIRRQPSLSFNSIAANTTGVVAVNMLQVKRGMKVTVTPLTILPPGLGQPYGIVSDDDYVTVYQPNLSGAAINTGATYYNITVSLGY